MLAIGSNTFAIQLIKMPKGFKNLGLAIEPIYREMGMEGEYVLGILMVKWCTIVGDNLAYNSEPVLINNGELLVRLSSPVWAEEFKFNSTVILDRLNTHLSPHYKINRLRYRVGLLLSPLKRISSINKKVNRDLKSNVIELIDREKEFIEASVSLIKDEDLKNSIKRAMEKSLMATTCRDRKIESTSVAKVTER